MQKESMLVIEDEDIMRDALADYFSGEGHRVDTANDGGQALEKINFKDYDVMIIDLKLPSRDGLSVLNEVRAQNPNAKVIIITAYPTPETKTKAMRQGAFDYLPKPFELDHLEDLIHKSFEIDIVPAPPVEEPKAEPSLPTPCIWTQAGIIKNRQCPNRYECQKGCDFYTAMMKKEKYRDDPRIKPYLDRVNCLLGKNQCRYTMSGELSFRACARVFNCANCELDQAIGYQRDIQLALKLAAKKKTQPKSIAQVTVKDKPVRTDH